VASLLLLFGVGFTVIERRYLCPAQESTMNPELDINDDMQWIEDLGGLSFDELRDLPFAVQAGMDTSVFE